MDFVAIDFETANHKRNSACAIGIAAVRNGVIVHAEDSLIRPPELYFHPNAYPHTSAILKRKERVIGKLG